MTTNLRNANRSHPEWEQRIRELAYSFWSRRAGPLVGQTNTGVERRNSWEMKRSPRIPPRSQGITGFRSQGLASGSRALSGVVDHDIDELCDLCLWSNHPRRYDSFPIHCAALRMTIFRTRPKW